MEELGEEELLASSRKPYKRPRQLDPDLPNDQSRVELAEERKSDQDNYQDEQIYTCQGNDNDTPIKMRQTDIENAEDLEAQRLLEEERRLVELNDQLEQEIKTIECELSMEGMRLKEVKQKNEDLDELVSGIKELGEKLKNEQ